MTDETKSEMNDTMGSSFTRNFRRAFAKRETMDLSTTGDFDEPMNVEVIPNDESSLEKVLRNRGTWYAAGIIDGLILALIVSKLM